MMRLPILLSLTLFTVTLSAQSWSPPGATWTYGLQDEGITGYSRYSYVGDTLLNDTVGQRIDLETVVVVDPDPTPVVNTHAGAVITSYANDVVSVWDQLSERWDTLFWFTAQIGDFWQPPHYEGECGDAERIEVEATGTLVEDGVTLRWLDLASDRGRIVERAGWYWNLEITPSCLIVEGLAGERCYTDGAVSYSPPTWTTDCFAIGMGEEPSNERVVFYPNPGTDHFTAQVPPGCDALLMRDALGRTVRQERLAGGTFVIDVTDLPSGAFAVHLLQGGRTMPGGAWIKY
jgi:hypothetical protein